MATTTSWSSCKQASNFVFWKLGALTQAHGQSNKEAPRPTSGKEYTEGWHWSKGIIVKLKGTSHDSIF